jgi:hypothetical protein
MWLYSWTNRGHREEFQTKLQIKTMESGVDMPSASKNYLLAFGISRLCVQEEKDVK